MNQMVGQYPVQRLYSFSFMPRGYPAAKIVWLV